MNDNIKKTNKTKLVYIKIIFLSSDFLISLSIATILYFLLPNSIANDFVKEIYDIGISVLSVIFSVYFAALSIVISSSDNNFIAYLQKIEAYSLLINIYRFTLILLFVALVSSMTVYMITLFLEEVGASTQRTYLFIIFAFLFSWGLLASLSIGLTTLRYALTRAKYVEISNGSKSNEESPYISDNN